MVRTSRVLLILLVLVVPARLMGQTIAGVVKDLSTNKTVGAARVALVDDSARVVATTIADSATSTFYLDAPHAGRFRVLLFVSGISFVSPPESLSAAQSVEREFRVPSLSYANEAVYFASDVTKPVQPLHPNAAPRYPDQQRSKGVTGSVTVTFVVDTTGRCEQKTTQVLRSTNAQFTSAVQAALPAMRFSPAELDGKRVRQVAQYTFAFGFLGNVPEGDIVITALGVVREKRD